MEVQWVIVIITIIVIFDFFACLGLMFRQSEHVILERENKELKSWSSAEKIIKMNSHQQVHKEQDGGRWSQTNMNGKVIETTLKNGFDHSPMVSTLKY